MNDWIFNFNEHTKKWNATTRDNYFALFNGKNDKVLSSSKIETLIDLIHKTNGDEEAINKILIP